MTSKNQWSKLLSPLHDEWQPHDRWDEIQAAIQRQTLHPLPSNTRKKPCKHPILYTVMAVACVAAIMCGAILNDFTTNKESLHSTAESDNLETMTPINEVIATIMPDHNPTSHIVSYTKPLSQNALFSYLKFDIRPSTIPFDLQFRQDLFEQYPPQLEYDSNNKLVETSNNNFKFLYTGGTQTPRQILIYFSKIHTEIGQMKYSPRDTTSPFIPSIINGISVNLGHLSTTDMFENFNERMPTERYVAEFTVAGIHMQVTTDNLTLDEFLAVVKSIIR